MKEKSLLKQYDTSAKGDFCFGGLRTILKAISENNRLLVVQNKILRKGMAVPEDTGETLTMCNLLCGGCNGAFAVEKEHENHSFNCPYCGRSFNKEQEESP